MARQRRVKFSVSGSHPLLIQVQEHFIAQGYQLESSDKVDFCLVGADAQDHLYGYLYDCHTMLCANMSDTTPSLILSSDDVYTCLGADLKVRPMDRMREEDALVVPSTLEYNTLKQASAIYTETLIRTMFPRSIIIRPFGVYGPQCHNTLVANITNKALHKEPMEIYAPDQRKRSYLYIDDFLDCVDRLLAALMKGQQGLYNVGSEEVISVSRLADSVHQLLNKTQLPAPVQVVRKDHFIDFWKIPDITRVKAVTKWKPTTSIRKGIWNGLGLVE